MYNRFTSFWGLEGPSGKIKLYYEKKIFIFIMKKILK